MEIAMSKPISTNEGAEKAKSGSKYPGFPDDELIKVTIGTIRDGSTKRKRAKFIIPGKK